MVRPVIEAQRGGWKAVAAIAVVAGGLIWHVLACVESPMAFAPDGKQLAFVTMDPYGGPDDEPLVGTNTYRLMVLSDEKQLRVLEETAAAMLTGPAWSPDGRHLAYLRIPLLTKDELERLHDEADKRKELLDKAEEVGSPPAAAPAVPPAEPSPEAAPGAPPPAAPTAAEPAAKSAASTEDLTLPPAENILEAAKGAQVHGSLPAILVVRDVASGNVVSATKFDLPCIESYSDTLVGAYLFTRPQYGPDGKRVYVCAGSVVSAIDPAEHKQQILAAPAVTAALSPDGRVVATLQDHAIGFTWTDGKRAIYRRYGPDKISSGGFAWLDDQTLALLEGHDEGPKPPVSLIFMRTDGEIVRTLKPAIPHSETDREGTGQLAIAPNGKFMVLSYGSEVFFLTMDGKTLATWKGEKEALVQPTFTPNSARVAFKLLKEGRPDQPSRVSAIVFFAPDGKEVSRANVPAPAPKAKKQSEPARTGGSAP